LTYLSQMSRAEFQELGEVGFSLKPPKKLRKVLKVVGKVASVASFALPFAGPVVAGLKFIPGAAKLVKAGSALAKALPGATTALRAAKTFKALPGVKTLSAAARLAKGSGGAISVFTAGTSLARTFARRGKPLPPPGSATVSPAPASMPAMPAPGGAPAAPPEGAGTVAPAAVQAGYGAGYGPAPPGSAEGSATAAAPAAGELPAWLIPAGIGAAALLFSGALKRRGR